MRIQPIGMPINEQSDVREASQLAKRISAEIGFDEYQSSMISLACSEICMNAINHGLGGTMLISETSNKKGIELTVEDSGPGIADLPMAMVDGYSTYGSLGLGLGAANRSVDEVIFNKHDSSGTSITLKHYLNIPRSEIATSVISRPASMEEQNGDANVIKQYDGESILAAVIDGSGKGKFAAITANFIAGLVKANYKKPLDELLLLCHQAVKTRNFQRMAEMCLLRVTPTTIEFAGVGNLAIHCTVPSINFSIQNGTVGLSLPRNIMVSKHPRPDKFLITLTSDGITENFNLNSIDYMEATPYGLAKAIYDHYCTGLDDTTVLVVKGAK